MVKKVRLHLFPCTFKVVLSLFWYHYGIKIRD
ncbi:hypothetical protein [Campylobacter phage CJLB-10]|nr:hypothetical protein [Campylobacter phage CJLB-7]QXO06026.1 hypothetical protein [Campylobacter phage CJLB-10]